MKSFEYASPASINEATALLSPTWGQTEILAGGTDLITSLKQHLTSPSRVVSLKKIADLNGIEEKTGEIRIGAMVTLGELAAHAVIRKNFPALTIALEGIGSPQLLSTGTVGGDLCQRPRCWYYRNGFGLLAKQGGKSLVRDGDNRYHAIFGNAGDACFVNASSLAPALIALQATLTVARLKGKPRNIDAEKFFQTPSSENQRETALDPTSILTTITIPLKGLKNATYEVRHRQGLDWPYVTASVAFELKGGRATNSRVVLGQVAPVPWLSPAAAEVLDRATVNESVAKKAGIIAAKGATPLSANAYKVQLVKTAVKRAALLAAA